MVDERLFAFDWVLSELRAVGPRPDFPNIEYLRQRLLEISMGDDINYQVELGKIPPGSLVVEIGAMDGVRFDPLHNHLVTPKWNAIVLEPLPDMFALLQKNYEPYPWVRCVNAAISDQSGQLSLFRVKPDAVAQHGYGEWVVGISSAFKGATLSYLDHSVSEEIVRALSFSDFVKEFSISRIDVLQIDTEGYDWKILEQVDLARSKVPGIPSITMGWT
jgi:FkbM family methyltransferase